MKIFLKAIEFEDYRNIKNGERLVFTPITTLVGANESGKTNIIRTIRLLRENFNSDDVKIGSERASRKKLPLLKYFFEIEDKEIIQYFKKNTKNFRDDNLICLIVDGDSKDLYFANRKFSLKEIDYYNKWRNITGQPIKIKMRRGKEIEIPPQKEILADDRNKLIVARLVRKKQLSKVEIDEVVSVLFDDFVEKFLPETEYWEYNQEKHYLPDHVFWDKFLPEPDKFLPVKNLFSIASVEGKLTPFATAFASLKGRDHEIQNYLDEVSNVLNKVIKKTWKQSNIELRLSYQTDKLRLDIYEGRRRTPPSVRSDGLKWFLSFLLSFRARGELENRIILFDQPGERLHPGGQKELRERFEEIASKNQIIFATQSPFLIDRTTWSKVKFLRRINGDAEIKQPTKFDVKNDELLRYSLGYSLVDVGQANDFNIVVEGYTDEFVFIDIGRRLNEIMAVLKKKPVINLNKISIFGVGGFTAIRKRVDELIQVKLRAIGLYDGDREGKARLKRDRKGKVFKNILFSLDEILENPTYQTIEDLIPGKLWETSCKEYFKGKITKKYFQHPRLERLKKWYQKSHKTQFSRKEKEALWGVVFNKWDKSIDRLKDLLGVEEIKLIKRVLEVLSKKF